MTRSMEPLLKNWPNRISSETPSLFQIARIRLTDGVLRLQIGKLFVVQTRRQIKSGKRSLTDPRLCIIGCGKCMYYVLTPTTLIDMLFIGGFCAIQKFLLRPIHLRIQVR